MGLITIDTDAFSDGQIRSKLWLCEKLEEFKGLDEFLSGPARIAVYGGWYGIFPFLLLSRARHPFKIEWIRSFDLDEEATKTANLLLNRWEMDAWKFRADTIDVNKIKEFRMNVIVNTSTEHMGTQWFRNVPPGMFMCLQGTDQVEPDHINTCSSLKEFEQKYKMSSVFFRGENTLTYSDRTVTRYMIIGIK